MFNDEELVKGQYNNFSFASQKFLFKGDSNTRLINFKSNLFNSGQLQALLFNNSHTAVGQEDC